CGRPAAARSTLAHAVVASVLALPDQQYCGYRQRRPEPDGRQRHCRAVPGALRTGGAEVGAPGRLQLERRRPPRPSLRWRGPRPACGGREVAGARRALSPRRSTAGSRAGATCAVAVAAWLPAVWLCGCVAAWLRGCVAVWLRGCVAAWLRGCVAAGL